MLLTVGSPFPGPVPSAPNGGAIFEILSSGDQFLTLQYPNTTPPEMVAIHSGFSSYSLYVAPDPPHVAVIVWKFEAPLGYVETPFHAGLYTDSRMNTYLEKHPHDNNALTMVGLDNQKITQLRISGLMHGFMEAFHNVVWRQLVETPLFRDEYQAELDKIYTRFTTKELYMRGKTWRHRQP